MQLPACGTNVFATVQLCAVPLAEVSEQACGMNPVIARLDSVAPLFCDILLLPVPAVHPTVVAPPFASVQRVAAVPDTVPEVRIFASVPCKALLLVTVDAPAAIGTCPVVMPDKPLPLAQPEVVRAPFAPFGHTGEVLVPRAGIANVPSANIFIRSVLLPNGLNEA